MRKHVLTLFLLCSGLVLCGQPKIVVSNLSVELRGDDVEIFFSADISKSAVGRSKTLIAVPILTDGLAAEPLRAIVVEGKGSRITWERGEWASQTRVQHDNGVYSKPGRLLLYRARIPYQPWMSGSSLVVDEITAGCCSSETESIPWVSGLLPEAEKNRLLAAAAAGSQTSVLPVQDPETAPTDHPKHPRPFVCRTSGDSLSRRCSFVVSGRELDPERLGRPIDYDRDDNLFLYFSINSHNLNPHYMTNASTLERLQRVLAELEASEEDRLYRIVITGFASPDGPYEFNDRLAWNRAVEVKHYLSRLTGIPAQKILLHNGSVNWDGLKSVLSRSDMYDKEREPLMAMLERSDGYDYKQRQRMLQEFGQGDPFEWMQSNLFPYLRTGAFITVYYEYQ